MIKKKKKEIQENKMRSLYKLKGFHKITAPPIKYAMTMKNKIILIFLSSVFLIFYTIHHHFIKKKAI